MKITLFGLIWLVLIIYCFAKKQIKYMVYLTLFSMIFQCNNVIVLGRSVGIGPQVITSTMFIVKSYLSVDRELVISINRKTITLIVPWIMLIICILISGVINNSIGNTYMRILQLIVYVFCFIRLLKVGKYSKNIDIDSMLHNIIWFVVLCGLLQFAMSIGVLPKFRIVANLLYNESSNDVVYFYNNNVRRLFSTFMEASYCAPFLVGSFYYLLYDYMNFKKNRSNKILMALLIVEVVLTFSATAYVVFIAGGCLYFLLFNQKKALLYKVLLIFIGIGVILILGDKITSLIERKLASGSGVARNGWNVVALTNFRSHLKFGIGYKYSRASSIVMTILGELGVFGIVSYGLGILSTSYKLIKQSNKNSKESRKYLIIMLCVMLSQFVACPDLDFCVFWFAMYVIAVAYSIQIYECNREVSKSNS